MWPFSKIYKLSETGLLMQFTDMHSHLLLGVDDGVTDEQEAVRIVRKLKEWGIQRSFLTPHIMEGLYGNTTEKLTECFEQKFLPLARQEEFEVCLAGEYMMDNQFTSLLEEDGTLLAYDGIHLLVEMSYQAPVMDWENILFEIQSYGYVPVLAHPERYLYLTSKELEKIKNKGIKLQLNLLSLAAYYGKPAYKMAVSLLEKQLYDFVGTDLHNEKMCAKINTLLVKERQIEQLAILIDNNNSLWDNCCEN